MRFFGERGEIVGCFTPGISQLPCSSAPLQGSNSFDLAAVSLAVRSVDLALSAIPLGSAFSASSSLRQLATRPVGFGGLFWVLGFPFTESSRPGPNHIEPASRLGFFPDHSCCVLLPDGISPRRRPVRASRSWRLRADRTSFASSVRRSDLVWRDVRFDRHRRVGRLVRPSGFPVRWSRAPRVWFRSRLTVVLAFGGGLSTATWAQFPPQDT